MKKNFLCALSVLLLAGCASSERMMRLSPSGVSEYKAPDEKRLQSKAYQKIEHTKDEKKTLAEENIINAWPFFLKNDYFYSILWPFIDYDPYGFAVRPFYNKEGDDHSILFPLAGWNSVDGSGWALNTFWGTDFLFVFPFAFYSSSESDQLSINDEYYKSNLFIFPFWSNYEKRFFLLRGSVNYMYFDRLISCCNCLKYAFDKSDMKSIIENKKDLAKLLKNMKIENDFTVPSNAAELDNFIAVMYKRYGVLSDKSSFGVFPLFGVSKYSNGSEFSLLLGLLHKSKYYYNDFMHSSVGKNSGYDEDFYFPGFVSKPLPLGVVEENSSRTLLLAQSSDTLRLATKNHISMNEFSLWSDLYDEVQYLAANIERDEYYTFEKYYEFDESEKEQKYKSRTPEKRVSVKNIADRLGITLPELKTSAQCFIFCKEIEGMCMEYNKVSNTSFMPFFEVESGDKGGRFEIFPLFFTEKYKIGTYGEKKRTNVLMLCHNQTVKDKVHQEKFEDVFEQINLFEQSLKDLNVKHDLPKALKEANLAFDVPKNYRECRELRQKVYALIPENTERISTFLPFYYYKSNDVLDDSYLNILGIFYNGGRQKQESWFNVLGFVARGFTEKDEEEFRILEFLYRSRKRKNEKDYLVFPFFYYRESENSSQFSFLHRIVNIEKSPKGTKGHIFYIPFGD